MGVKDIDKEDMKSVLEAFPKQCKDSLRLGKDVKIEDKIEKIVVTGMGGSAISGNLLKSFLSEQRIDVHVNRDYTVPNFVDKKSLVFAISYSGNTEETLAAYDDALKKGARIVAISSGGKLFNLSVKNKTAHIKIPSGIQPRLATAYLFFPMLTVLKNNKIIRLDEAEIQRTIETLKKPVFKNMAQDLVTKLVNRIPIIYASERFKAVAMKWKTDINENAKVHAFYNVYSEFNHNEINGYVNKTGDFYVVIIRDEEDIFRIRKRMLVTKNLIKKKGVSVTEIVIKGNSFLTRLLSAIYTGTWVSYFLALEYETDPTPVDMIEDLKKQI